MTSSMVMSCRMEYSCVITLSLRFSTEAERSSFFPSTRISPEVGRSTVEIMLMVVVLPAPFGPSRPKNSPVST